MAGTVMKGSWTVQGPSYLSKPFTVNGALLAPVAFSGDFNTLSGQPQYDFQQASTSAVDYIQNKFNYAMQLPVGTIHQYAGGTAPAGYLLCDGTAYLQTAYPNLFAVIGTTYGSTSTQFSVPNLPGKTCLGCLASNTNFQQLAQTGGSMKAVLATSQMPQHTHTFADSHTHVLSDPGHTHVSLSQPPGKATNSTIGASSTIMQGIGVAAGSASLTMGTSSTGITIAGSTVGLSAATLGTSAAFNTAAPFVVLNHIIKY